ncbi:hypothetical protein L249_4055 [Ophiocordyceps polyrhachis-furcata BCC 54312]|uniref:Uncharacterized protein n=1 Tax=Ophiocordyceps polyrhachis-furcata BCC 54312 TaxID=1330021 RepID=A0A367L5R7_9HYPO|nr:hypothetical protein L249_4055 [Ophiocordyceps polyrhachis-furcata BCC 54312]
MHSVSRVIRGLATASATTRRLASAPGVSSTLLAGLPWSFLVRFAPRRNPVPGRAGPSKPLRKPHPRLLRLDPITALLASPASFANRPLWFLPRRSKALSHSSHHRHGRRYSSAGLGHPVPVPAGMMLDVAGRIVGQRAKPAGGDATNSPPTYESPRDGGPTLLLLMDEPCSLVRRRASADLGSLLVVCLVGLMHDMQQYQQWEADRNPRAWSYPVMEATLALWRTAMGLHRRHFASLAFHPYRRRTAHQKRPCFLALVLVPPDEREHKTTHSSSPLFLRCWKGVRFFIRTSASCSDLARLKRPGQRLPSLAEPEVRLTPKAGMRLSTGELSRLPGPDQVRMAPSHLVPSISLGPSRSSMIWLDQIAQHPQDSLPAALLIHGRANGKPAEGKRLILGVLKHLVPSGRRPSTTRRPGTPAGTLLLEPMPLTVDATTWLKPACAGKEAETSIMSLRFWLYDRILPPYLANVSPDASPHGLSAQRVNCSLISGAATPWIILEGLNYPYLVPRRGKERQAVRHIDMFRLAYLFFFSSMPYQAFVQRWSSLMISGSAIMRHGAALQRPGDNKPISKLAGRTEHVHGDHPAECLGLDHARLCDASRHMGTVEDGRGA